MISDMHHLVGPREIAEMLGVSRQRVTQLTEQPGFPKPEVNLAMGKVWRTEDVIEWAKQTGRRVEERD
jgi:predicted DNA-binding transcriptional regulator AlpA